MAHDDQQKRVQPNLSPPPLLQYTVEQYIESPSLVKQTNEWLLNIYQHLSEKDKQLQHAELELRSLEEECHRLGTRNRTLEEKTLELMEKDKKLQLTKQELNYLKEGSLRASIIQHALGLLTAISLGVGINFATSTPSNGAGWPLIFIGIATQSISFYVTYSEARKNSK